MRPAGTPYTGGLYEFDIFLPSKHPGYPSLPPKVELLSILELMGASNIYIRGEVPDYRWWPCEVQSQPLQRRQGLSVSAGNLAWGSGGTVEQTDLHHHTGEAVRLIQAGNATGMFRFSYPYKVSFSYLNPTTTNPGF